MAKKTCRTRSLQMAGKQMMREHASRVYRASFFCAGKRMEQKQCQTRMLKERGVNLKHMGRHFTSIEEVLRQVSSCDKSLAVTSF